MNNHNLSGVVMMSVLRNLIGGNITQKERLLYHTADMHLLTLSAVLSSFAANNLSCFTGKYLSDMTAQILSLFLLYESVFSIKRASDTLQTINTLAQQELPARRQPAQQNTNIILLVLVQDTAELICKVADYPSQVMQIIGTKLGIITEVEELDDAREPNR